MTRPLPIAVACLALVLGPKTARAEGEIEEARRAYADGAEAYDAHEYAHAAVLFGRADELVPNPQVLELALAAVTKVDDPVLAIRLARRAENRGGSDSLLGLARGLRSRLGSKVGLIRVRCEASVACAARTGDQEARDGETLVVRPGDVDLAVTVGERSLTDHLLVGAGETVIFDARVLVGRGSGTNPLFSPNPPLRELPPTDSPGISSAWFWTGVAVSGVLLGSAIVSSVETAQRYDRYAAAPTAQGRDAGKSSQLRTNVLWIATGVSAVTTSAIGIWAVRWRTSRPMSTAWSVEATLETHF